VVSQKITNYRQLKFWQTSFETTKLIFILARKLQSNIQTKILLNQLIRASSSIGANIAEGFGRYKGKEYCRFLQIALGSANETEYWLILLKELYPVYTSEIDNIISLNLETTRMLVATLKTLKNIKTTQT
jgi:four helix bundle protein